MKKNMDRFGPDFVWASAKDIRQQSIHLFLSIDLGSAKPWVTLRLAKESKWMLWPKRGAELRRYAENARREKMTRQARLETIPPGRQRDRLLLNG
jgi:hypothetical protein